MYDSSSTDTDSLPSTRAAFYVFRVTQLCSRTESLLNSRKPRTSTNLRKLFELIREAEALDKDLETWCEDYPVWRPQVLKCCSPSNNPASSEPQRIDVYANLLVLRNWNLYRTARMELHKTLLECGKYLFLDHWSTFFPCAEPDSTARAKSHTSKQIIRKTAADVCASIAYGMGDVDQDGNFVAPRPDQPNGKKTKAVGGFFLLCALNTVAYSEHAEECHRKEAKAALQRIGWSMGLRQTVRRSGIVEGEKS